VQFVGDRALQDVYLKDKVRCKLFFRVLTDSQSCQLSAVAIYAVASQLPDATDKQIQTLEESTMDQFRRVCKAARIYALSAQHHSIYPASTIACLSCRHRFLLKPATDIRSQPMKPLQG